MLRYIFTDRYSLYDMVMIPALLSAFIAGEISIGITLTAAWIAGGAFSYNYYKALDEADSPSPSEMK